jgi:hypothetical protein
MHPQDSPLEWLPAGASAYYALHDGRIAAILYIDDLDRGALPGHEDEFAPGVQGWFLVMADKPRNHEHLPEWVLRNDMPEDERDGVHETMLFEATMVVRARLAGEEAE